jgi:Ca2+-binding EF-hand superfamily protein
MRTHVLAAAVVALPLAILPAMVPDAEAQRTTIRSGLAAMDTNGDGKITREEWRGTRQSFITHDWDGDGVLSGEEVRPGGRRTVAEDPDFTEGRLELRDWTAARFTRLDINRDRRIVRAEWPYDWESFRRADRNRDNILSRVEFLAEDNIDDDRDDRFVDLDVNGNGRIERREWHASRESFDWLDRNRDNVLTYNEVIGTEPAETDTTSLFARLDVDRSGRVEMDEWHWSRASFERRDANRDGVLQRNEVPTTEPATPGAVGTAGRTLVVDSTVRWTDTGINVRAGQFVTIHAEGTVQMSTDPNDIADPWGARSGRRAPNSPDPHQPAGGLIAMISGSTPVFVGNRSDTRLRMPASGRLYLSVNDDHLGDNRGEFRVTITVER